MRRSLPVLLVAVGLADGPALAPVLSAQVHDAEVCYDDDHLPAAFHEGRRQAVMDRLPGDALAILFGAPVRNRSNDVSFKYRQQSDFLYLTGSSEPGSVLVLAPGGVTVDGRRVREVLFVPPRDPAREIWLGRRFGTERAMDQLGVELALESTRFEEIVSPLLASGTYRVHHLPLPDGVASDIGVRIEDDILVTDGGPVNLSAGVPRSWAEVEAFMGGGTR